MSDQAKRIIAVFHPQAWVNDYAVDVDPEGDTEWDVTDDILAMGRDAALAVRDDQYESDNLCDGNDAPKWIKDWGGPFYVEVEQAIADYFANAMVADVPDICKKNPGEVFGLPTPPRAADSSKLALGPLAPLAADIEGSTLSADAKVLAKTLLIRMALIESESVTKSNYRELGKDEQDECPTGDTYNDLWDAVLDEIIGVMKRPV